MVLGLRTVAGFLGRPFKNAGEQSDARSQSRLQASSVSDSPRSVPACRASPRSKLLHRRTARARPAVMPAPLSLCPVFGGGWR